MAEPLKNQYGKDIPQKIAAMISAVYPRFQASRFLDFVLPAYDELELLPRGWHMADGLYHALPADYAKAVDILLASLPAPKPALSQSSPTRDREGGSLAPFLFMPHTFFVARYGLSDFESSMRAQYELTQRFTAEFSIRPFLQEHRQATLQRLQEWIDDPSEHVRRLVSEGTRPRLPWAVRLPEFQREPAPVLALLEQLKDDPSLYVRRSVANNLNDIGKDHPDLLLATAERWHEGASKERQWLIKHALRNTIKAGEPRALALFGFSSAKDILVDAVAVSPRKVQIGSSATFSCTLVNAGRKPQSLLVDFRVHFIKGNGESRPKVFKLTQLTLPTGESVNVSKKISLAPMTTRRLYPGRHQIDLLINGTAYPLGHFILTESAAVPATDGASP